jgi:alpha-glucosidase (family GH31 glycosyl hydrolase)
MLGNQVLVAPISTKSNTRQVVLPKGSWTDYTGKTWKGGQTITIEVPIDQIPIFNLKK